MVDFKKMAASQKTELSLIPKEIFDRLPKPQSFDDLHSSQAEVLDTWFCKRKIKDTVIKLNTGGGKTLVGLLIALSSARELKRGALYLVDSKQLVRQVCDQAKTLGISASEYNGRSSLTADFRNGSTILVAHYQALFNGKSSFGLEGSAEVEEVSVIVIDDAHSSFDTVRDAFTVTIRAGDAPDLYKDIAMLFRQSFVAIDRETTFDDFILGVRGIGDEVLEVPFWAWEQHRQQVARSISDFAVLQKEETPTSKSISFGWPLVKDELRYCLATLSCDGFTITPILPLVEKFPTFYKSPRRVYMSATFADESAIIRSFGCGKDNLNIISPKTLAGVGRRMVLEVGEKEQFRKALVNKMIALAKDKNGVVILTPSFATADHWNQLGMAIVKGSEIDRAVNALKERALDTPIVFVNRYNGIDLPGNACRMLVVSGIPKGMSDHQKLMSKILAHSKVYARSIAQNIEQAIGRGTRGSGDYCVVALVGLDLCEWVKEDRHAIYLTPTTRAQIECGHDIMNEIHSVQDFMDTIDQGVNDDPDFAAYLSGYVADKVGDFDPVDDSMLEGFALCERKALRVWRRGNSGQAIEILRQFSASENLDSAVMGLVLRIAAQIAYSDNDIETSRELQSRAAGLNPSLAKPMFSNSDSDTSLQAKNITKYVSEQARKTSDTLTKFNADLKTLSEQCNSKEFEAGLELLGKYLGANSKRCDKNGDGPDVAWVFEEEKVAFALEAKNEKLPDKPLTKEEHGQLRVAEAWLRKQNPRLQCIAISVHPNNFAYENASADSARVLTLRNLADLVKSAGYMIATLSSGTLNEQGRLSQCDALLSQHNLRPTQIVDAWTERFEIKESGKTHGNLSAKIK